MGFEFNLTLRTVLSNLDPSLIVKRRADEGRTYCDIELLSSDYPPRDENVIYLCSSTFLTDESDKLTQCCFLIKDKGSFDFRRLRCDYVILAPEVSIGDTLHSLRSLFQTITSKTLLSFQDELVSTGSIRGILELASQEMECPMLLCNDQRQTIIHVGDNYSDDPSFSMLVEEGSHSEGLLSAARTENIESLLLRADFPVLVATGKYRKSKRIFSWIRINGFRSGYLIALERERSFTSFSVLSISTICNAISAIVEKSGEFHHPIHLEEYIYQNHLGAILSGDVPADSDCTLFRDARFHTGYLVCINASRNRKEDIPFFADLFQLLGTRTHMLSQMDDICALLISYDRSNPLGADFTKFKNLLIKHHHKAGFSDLISSQEELRKCYLQAVDALEICSEDYFLDCCAFYKDVKIQLLIRDLPPHKKSSYYDDSLDMLLEYDRQKGTEYYCTLFTFITSAHNRAVTAKKRFLHRNTVSYQLNKIEELLGFSLDDGERCFYLYLSYKINEMRGISPITST